MRRSLTLLVVCGLAVTLSACSSGKTTEKQEGPGDSLISISEKDLSEKRWCFSSYILYFKNDRTCYVTRMEDERIDWASGAEWALTYDTLLIIQKDDKLLHDTAFYKINVIADKLTARLVKKLNDDDHKSYLLPFPDKDFNNSPEGEESVFWQEELYVSLENKHLTGTWHGEGMISELTLNPDSSYSTYGGASQSLGATRRTGKWKVKDWLIVLMCNQEIRPATERVTDEEEGEHLVEMVGVYDTLGFPEVYDTLHVTRSTTFRLFTQEHGVFIGGANKDFLRSIGYPE